ncbi:MAG TPA: immunoglobulin domain-containing protein [Opitutaceae bacterium]|nr:immunoglobulin domain-containing protein [Opitutaceae bacterium]
MKLTVLFETGRQSPARMIKKLVALFAAGWACMGASGDTAPPWTHKVVAGDIAYFAFATPARIERYDMAGEQWLPSIALTNSPTALAVDENAIAIAYNRAVVTRALDGTGEAGLINQPNDVAGLLLSPDFIFVVSPSYANPSITSVRRSDRQFVATWSGTYAFGSGFAIAPAARRIYGIDTMTSGASLDELTFNPDGTFPTGYPGYRSAGSYYYTSAHEPRTYVSPDEGTLILGAGYVFDADSLTYRASLAGSFDDMVYYGNDVPILLRGDSLYAYSNAFLESGSKTLSVEAQALALRSGDVFAFSADANQASGVVVEKVAIGSFTSAQPGAALDPAALNFVPDDVIAAGDGTFFIFSRTHQSIFRWSGTTRSYTASYPLLGSALHVAYSPQFDRLYTAYSSGKINQIKLDADETAEVPFANLPTSARGLAAAGNYILAVDESNWWNTHYTFDIGGTLKSSRDWSYISKEYVWSSVNQRMYFFRDDSSPNDLLYEPIDADGQLGPPVDSPYHGEYSFVHPIRLSTDQTGVLIGSGLVFTASTLTYAGSLANNVTDAVSRNNRWMTIRNATVDSQIQTWTQNLLLDKGMTVPGYAFRVFNLPDGKLLALTTTGGSISPYPWDNVPNSGGLVMSIVDPDTGSVQSSPVITTGPASETVYVGSSVTLTVTATGSDLNYQWRRGGHAINGATTSELVLSGLQVSDSGSYSVTVSNAIGLITSAAATLTVEPLPPPPVIEVQPLAQAAFPGGWVWFEVSASGAALSYQWRKEGVPIDGATNSWFNITTIKASDYGDYDVVVSNPGGFVTSDSAALSTPPPPEFLSHPQSATAALGTHVWLSVGVNGLNLRFQWRKDGVPLVGRTGYDIYLGPITAADYGSYDCVVSNPAGSVTSQAAFIAAVQEPGIVAHPSSHTAVLGGNVTYAVTVSGIGPFAYQWRRNGVNIAGATGATLTLSNVQAGQGGNYSVVVTNSAGSVTSNAAALTIDTTPRLINVSCRGFAGAGDDTLVMGFYITGNTDKTVLIRGVGPKLLEYNVPSVVADPRITVYRGNTPLAGNDDWDATLAPEFARMGGFALDAGSKDAAMTLTLAPGGYTVHLVNNGSVAEGLIEVYDLSRDLGSRLTNVSCRLNMKPNQTIILGTALIGSPVSVLARNIGPGLALYLPEGTGVLADPHLRVYSGGAEIAVNDDWDTATGAWFGPTGAFSLPAGSKDAAVRVPFTPGGVTIHATGKGGGGGIAIIELYESP